MSASQLIANRFDIKDLEQDLLGWGGMGDVYKFTIDGLCFFGQRQRPANPRCSVEREEK